VAVDGLISVHVQQVEDVLHVVQVRDLSSHQVYQGLDDGAELLLGEPIILVLVELRKNLLGE
jgi:hypothetical protein